MLLITRLDVLDDEYYCLAFEGLYELKEKVARQQDLWAITYETEKAVPVCIAVYEPVEKGVNIIFTSGNSGMNTPEDIKEGFEVIKENLSRNDQKVTYVGTVK